MSIDLDNPDAVRAEAERRAQLRAQGLPLATPTPPPPPDARKVARLEKEVQSAVWKRFVAFGARGYWLSQARRSGQTPGLPDLWVFFPRRGLALWWETKATGGKLRPEQAEFQELCGATGVLHGVGGIAEAEAWLVQHGIAERVGGTLYPSEAK